MCGRYSLGISTDELVEIFDVPDARESALEELGLPRYNIAPSQEAPALVLGSDGRRLGPLRWGLVPFWADDPSIGNRLINARSETAHEKPAFRQAFRKRRCLIPADGFYEWKKPESGNGSKTPYWIHHQDDEILTMAGLWERWEPEEEDEGPLTTFTILTTDASEGMSHIHPRMPVLIPPDGRDTWMSRDTDPGEARELLHPPPEDILAAREVSTYVNSPENEGRECVEKVEE